jgi:hypothetical protein
VTESVTTITILWSVTILKFEFGGKIGMVKEEDLSQKNVALSSVATFEKEKNNTPTPKWGNNNNNNNNNNKYSWQVNRDYGSNERILWLSLLACCYSRVEMIPDGWTWLGQERI